jgi:hypothetical protein
MTETAVTKTSGAADVDAARMRRNLRHGADAVVRRSAWIAAPPLARAFRHRVLRGVRHA